MADPTNPYMPSGLDRLSMMLMAMGSGVSGAEASGRSGWSGIPAGAAMYSQANQQQNQQAMQWAHWQQQQKQQDEYRKVQEENIRSQIDERKRAAKLEENLMGMVPGLMQPQGGGGPPGMGVPPPTPTMGPGGDYFSITGGAESGGKYNAVNGKGSGAYGKYQFMPDTWASIAPSLGLPFNIKQATPDQQEMAMRELTKRNAQALGTNDPAALYLAHRFGAGGAKTVLSAPPNTQIASLFPPTWAQQNPDMQGVTVGQFRQTAQQRFGGASPPNAQGQGDAAGGGSMPPPQMPGPPPNLNRFAPLALSPRLAPLGNVLQKNEQNQYEHGWKAYDAGAARQNETRDQGNKDRDYDFQVKKYEGEGQFVRGADGVEKWVPQAELRGTTRADKPPEPGTVTGDIAVINKALKDPSFASSPEYAASYYRAKGHLIDGPNGLKYAPNMDTYPAPASAGGAAPAPNARAPDATGMTPIGDKTYTETQNKDHTYASRLANSIPQLEAMIKDGDKYTTARLPSSYERAKMNSSYVPDTMVSDNAKAFRRVTNDIVTALLRRESGANIPMSEYPPEFSKFIPQPGDSDTELRAKMKGLKIAAKTFTEATGRPSNAYGNAFDDTSEPPKGPIRIDMRGDRK